MLVQDTNHGRSAEASTMQLQSALAKLSRPGGMNQLLGWSVSIKSSHEHLGTVEEVSVKHSVSP